jgi:integrase
VSPFLSKGAKTYKGRAWDRAGNRYVRSLGTTSKAEANLVQAYLMECRRRRDWRTLDAVIGGRLPAIEAYHLALEGGLAKKLADIDAAEKEAAEPDLDPLVTEWARVATSDKYVRQVRSMIPEGKRYGLSQFTRKAVSTHLAGLKVSGPTRNRYRVALSQFARWLVEREYLDANPVRDVRGFKEHDPRMQFYTREEAQAVMRWLEYPVLALEAFMVGAGLEVGAVLRLRRRDVNIDTREVQVRGTKNRWRARAVRVTEDWAWQLLVGYVRQFTPDAPLFPRITERAALDAHKAACKAAGVAVTTLHDWRHTYAIQALKDGLPPQTVKRQLGHSPHSTMLERVYASWLPKTDADYAPRSATTTTAKAKRAKA